ncbi:MAG: RNA polymerase sigma factor [Terriglobia bacterium]
MAPAEAASPEPPILRARAQGRLSAHAAFEQLYALYAPTVLGWLALRVKPADADDLFQDVWTVFYGRWRSWQFLPEMQAPGARPVLSFLYRTCHFTLRGHRRRAARVSDPLEAAEVPDGLRGPERLLQQLQIGQCLQLARGVCPPEELDVLLAKLAGVPAREIARTLEITEPAVDHRFRNAVARLQKAVQPGGRKGARKKNA